MLLRKFEAYGFKSFADKTELDFGTGITAIVGPNGSGKSNIADAIRWTLGEQSVRNLRGARMEDIIFAGSSGRRALGVAEVSLTFDNSDGTLPLDYNEVMITRRVFRSGESEYYINKSACRLKDIYELLADTGLGKEAMAVIGQNKIDEILNSKPDERRSFFEEAAGITKYKQRKKDALRKLEDTGQNLVRVVDITTELESQLGPLAESAERTARYNEIKSELTACQVTLLLNKLEKAENMVTSITLEKENLMDAELAANTNLVVCETNKERLTDQLAKEDQHIASLDKELSRVNTETERLDAQVAVLEERIAQGTYAQTRSQEEIARLEQQQTRLCLETDTLQATLGEKEGLRLETAGLLEKQNEHHRHLIEQLDQTRKQLEAGKEATFQQVQELVTERNALRMLERDLDTSRSRQAKMLKEREVCEVQLQEIAGNQHEAALQCDTLRLRQEGLMAEGTRLAAAKQHQEQLLQQTENQGSQVVQRLNELSSRMQVLASMQDEYEGFGRGIKSILKHDAVWRKQIIGAVAEIIRVPEKFITAVEIALGGAMQHLVTSDDSVAKQAIQFLKSRNLGRATFLPLNTIRPAQPRERELAAARAPGALGFAAGLVDCAPEYRRVVEFLLGRTVIAQTIDDALRIAKQHAFGVKIVTLDGEVLNPGGSLTGGSTGRKEVSFLSRGHEIEQLKLQIAATEKKAGEMRDLMSKLRAERVNIEEKLGQVTQERQKAEIRQAELSVHLERIQSEKERMEFALRSLLAEDTSYTTEQQQMQDKLIVCQKRIIALESREVEQKKELTAWQQSISQLEEAREASNTAVTHLKLQINTIVQEALAIQHNYRQLKNDQEKLQEQLLLVKNEVASMTQQVEEARNGLKAAKELRVQLTADKERSELLRQQGLTAKVSILTMMQKIDKELKELRQKHQDLSGRLHEMDILVTKYGYEATRCLEQLTEQFGLDKQQAMALHRAGKNDDLLKTVQRLEARIVELGPINPAAIEEYTRLNDRYQFLQKQYQDLVEAKEYLASIIRDMDQTMSKQFKAAFETINGYFGSIFARLFGGGQAYLEMVEPNSILETGIEIIAQPPGKKLQNLSLLSGGERALTVIALLFAFLTYRPAPFSVLDEVDAALDEANVQRFSEFLRDYAQNTQFIVVTHRKGTMEVADIMHGVTMEESGVSRIVSVKFMDKAG